MPTLLLGEESLLHEPESKARGASLPNLKVTMSVAESCLTLGDPMGCSPPGSSVHGIYQAKKLKCVVNLNRVNIPLKNFCRLIFFLLLNMLFCVVWYDLFVFYSL